MKNISKILPLALVAAGLSGGSANASGGTTVVQVNNGETYYSVTIGSDGTITDTDFHPIAGAYACPRGLAVAVTCSGNVDCQTTTGPDPYTGQGAWVGYGTIQGAVITINLVCTGKYTTSVSTTYQAQSSGIMP